MIFFCQSQMQSTAKMILKTLPLCHQAGRSLTLLRLLGESWCVLHHFGCHSSTQQGLPHALLVALRKGERRFFRHGEVNASICHRTLRNDWSLRSMKIMATNPAFIHHKNPLCLQAVSSFSTSSSNLLEGSIDHTEVAREIICATRTIDVMVDSIPEQNIINLIAELSGFGFTATDMKRLFSGRLWLLKQGDAVMSSIQLLQLHGLNKSVILRVLENLPAHYQEDERALRNLPGVLERSLNQLKSSGHLSGKRVKKLLSKAPLLLIDDTVSVSEKVAEMKELFTVNDALSMIERCPDILTEDWDVVKEKFNYAFFTMGYHQEHIVTSQLFRHSIEHIEDRHLLLSRAGLIVTVKKKDPHFNPNPPLKDVVDSSDEQFMQLFGGNVGVEEYWAFRDMREVERDSKESDDNSDSDVMSSSVGGKMK